MRNRRSSTLAVLSFLMLGTFTAHANDFPADLPPQYKNTRTFRHYVDKTTLPEQMANLAGFTLKEYGRGFALIAGVSKYKNIPGRDGNLKPAAEDIKKLVNYLKYYEKIDEIVVLEDDDVTLDNLSYFLENYFPRRLEQFPRSRFLFAYSGHGSTQGNRGYLLKPNATSVRDTYNTIALSTLRRMFQRVIDTGFQVLVMINACYGGAFVDSRTFGPIPYIPKAPGAHAIAAGGSDEPTWHRESVGTGSIFFESFFQALDGQAGKEGVVTFYEMAGFLQRQLQVLTDFKQNPAIGYLRPASPGSFFFFNRSPLVANNVLAPWDGTNGVPFGAAPSVSPNKPITPQDRMQQLYDYLYPKRAPK
jgi:hypothetical protein